MQGVKRVQEPAIADEQEYLFRADSELLEDDFWGSANCRGAADPEVFFPISPSDLRSRAAALRYCEPCEVRAQCLEAAVTDPALHGIWGGKTDDERRALRRAEVRAS